MDISKMNQYGELFIVIRIQGILVTITGYLKFFVLTYLTAAVLIFDDLPDMSFHMDLAVLILKLFCLILLFSSFKDMLYGLLWIIIPGFNPRARHKLLIK